MAKLKIVGKVKPVPQAKTRTLTPAVVSTKTKSTEVKLKPVPGMTEVLDTLFLRIGAPILSRVRMDTNPTNGRKEVRSAELKFEAMSRKVLEGAFADLTCEEQVTKNENDWGYTHQGSWHWISPDPSYVFRVRFIVRRYRDASVMVLVTLDFSTKAELAAEATRRAERDAARAAKAAEAENE